MTAGKAAPAKAPVKADVKKADNTAAPAPKKSDKPDEAGSADPASDSIARHPVVEE